MCRVAPAFLAAILLASAIPVEARQILGSREQQASIESSFILTATVQ